MQGKPVVQGFITSATLEVRFMPAIDTALSTRIAQAMLAEVKKGRSYGAQAHVIARDDHVSISIENVEESEMTPSAYGNLLERLRNMAASLAVER